MFLKIIKKLNGDDFVKEGLAQNYVTQATLLTWEVDLRNYVLQVHFTEFIFMFKLFCEMHDTTDLENISLIGSWPRLLSVSFRSWHIRNLSYLTVMVFNA